MEREIQFQRPPPAKLRVQQQAGNVQQRKQGSRGFKEKGILIHLEKPNGPTAQDTAEVRQKRG